MVALQKRSCRWVARLLAIALVLFSGEVFAGEPDNQKAVNSGYPSLLIREEFRSVTMETPLPRPPASRYDCDYQYYYDDTATHVYAWNLPNEWGVDLYNTRFTVEPGKTCSLKVGWILMLGEWMTGTPDMRIYLWDDDGTGFPGTLLDSVEIPYAELPHGGFGWVTADWTANGNDWIFADGEEYHIGWTVLGGIGDTLWCVSDMATGPHSGEERCSNHYNGSWETMSDLFGIDVVLLMASERCCFEGSLPGITLSQVDWVLGDSVVENTAWGRIGVDEDELTSYTGTFGYLNGYTDTGWVIENLIIDVTSGGHEICTYFDLGVSTGIDLDSLSIYLRFTTEPIGLFQDGPRATLPVGSVYYAVGGVGNRPQTVPPPPPKSVGDGKGSRYVYRQMAPNIQCARCQCIPCAVSNNLQYIEDTYPWIDVPDPHVMGLGADGSLVGQHDVLMNRPILPPDRTVGAGVWFIPWVNGKFEYLNDNGLSNRLVHHHQGYGYGGAGCELPQGDYTHVGITSIDETDPALTVDFDWIRDCVEQGEAVELCENSHAVRAIACSDNGFGQRTLTFLHDALQSDIDPLDQLGLEERQCDVGRDAFTNELTLDGAAVSFVMATAPRPNRGDVNLNGTPYEIADAVLFSRYFLYGLSAFTIDPQAQIAQTDVNADGIPLTVGDLVYMIRVVIGNALPFPPKASGNTVFVVQDTASQTMLVDYADSLSALYLIFDNVFEPEFDLPYHDVEWVYDPDSSETRVLIMPCLDSLDFPSIPKGLLGTYSGDGVLRQAEAASDGLSDLVAQCEVIDGPPCCVTTGDVDCDGYPYEVGDSLALSLVLQYNDPGLLCCEGTADINGDCVVDSADYWHMVCIIGGDCEPMAECGGCWRYTLPSCCTGMRGNVNHDLNDDVNIVDLTYLVAYLFGGGAAPPCEPEGNVEGNDGTNIVDLTYLVEYLFAGGDPPPACGESVQAPPSGKPRTDLILRSSTEDGITAISLESPVNLRGIQIELIGTGDGQAVKLVGDNLELFFSQSEGSARIGILDMEGATFIEKGSYPLVRLPGEYEVVSAVVSGIDNNAVIPAIESATSQIPFAACGWLVAGVECILFQAEPFGLYVLYNLGGFNVGDYVYVTGTFNPWCITFCMEGMGCIEDNTITPCGECCLPPLRGNVDYDLCDKVNIADLSYLVNWLFGNASVLLCSEEADVNADGVPDIVDVTQLVDYLFTDGDPPLPCDATAAAPRAGKPRGDLFLRSSYQDGKTTISIESPVNLRGLQIELTGGGDGEAIKLVDDDLELFFRQAEGSARIGIFDMEGTSLIEKGHYPLVRLPGQYEIVNAVVSDMDNQAVVPQIGFSSKSTQLPERFALHQNYPNPFNPITTISFEVPHECDYTLSVYNIVGQRVTQFVGYASPGEVSIEWDASRFASGVYLYRLEAGSFTETKKMILLK